VQPALTPTQGEYVSRTRDRRPLRFSANADPAIERAYRTHWVSTDLSEKERERVTKRASKAPELLVVSPIKDWKCAMCGGTGDLLIMDDAGPLCLRCADMDHVAGLLLGELKPLQCPCFMRPGIRLMRLPVCRD
jgi:hypothetical protein